MADNILLFPEFQKLKEEVNKLRTELSMLVAERDELFLIERKNIETTYLLTLGSLEYKAYEAQCICLRLKRKMELIQAKINRQEIIELVQIEDTLNDEFAEYQEKLEELLGKMNAAIKRNRAEVLSKAQAKELKTLYRRIVKSLHPDWHPDLTSAQLDLFRNAVTAYENGDLETLRIIDEMVYRPEIPEADEGAMTVLVQEKQRLTALLQSVKAGIDKIKSEYPYTFKELVQNPEKLARRKAEIEDMIREYEEMAAAYSARIAEMVR